MFFAHFPWWREAATAVGPLAAIDRTGGRDPSSTAALNWLAANLRRLRIVVGTDSGFRRPGGQWHVALVVYFRRAVCRRDVAR
jgi:hypothetical protein